MVGDNQWALVTDEFYPWHGPSKATGILIWAHGFGSDSEDYRGYPSQAWVKAFSDAGFDIVRFERDPASDRNNILARERLKSGLTYIRHLGYRKLVVSGQSRGGWNALQMMMFPGLEDAVIAISPAAFGHDAHTVPDMNTAMATINTRIAEPRTRLAFVQFKDDPFAGDEDARKAMVENHWSSRLSSVLMIDRPSGFQGHGGGNGEKFMKTYGACLVQFVTTASLPAHLVHPGDFCASPKEGSRPGIAPRA